MRRLLPLLLLLTACGAQTTSERELDRSLAEWQIVAQETPNYRYSRYFQSWAGYWQRTTIEVIGGLAVSRAFESGEVGTTDPASSWSENSSQLGTHAEGDRAATIDELYTECTEEILTKDPAHHEIAFLVDHLGILKTCTYRPLQCADDCVIGIEIESLEFFVEP